MHIIIRIFLLASAALAAAIFAGCATARSRGPQPVPGYLAFLEAHPGADLSGPKEAEAIRNFKNYLAQLSPPVVRRDTRKVYASNAWFNDTLKTVRGSAAVEEHFLKTLENLEEFKVVFTDVARSGEDYYFRWVMDNKFKSFHRGKVVRTIGMSHVRFNEDGQVLLHQDYWDSAQGFFEYVPVIGGGIRFIKSKI